MDLVSTSVVIACYTERRWPEIQRAVASVLSQQPAPDEVIVVVDHNDELLARVRRAWPELVVIANAQRPGLSGARNSGVEISSGEVVSFLDDDAAARPGWLAGLRAPFADPAVVAVGGWSYPNWSVPQQPRMFPPELYWVVGSSYRGLPRHQAEIRNVIGCSMAFRRAVLMAAGGFNSDLGRVGTLPLGCEETELCIRIRQLDPGARIVLNPASVVDHRVSPDRESWRYLISRSYSEGVSKAAITTLVGRQSALETERNYVRRTLPAGIRRELRSGHPSAAAAIVASLGAAGIGYLRASRQLRRLPLSPSGAGPNSIASPSSDHPAQAGSAA